MIVARVCCCVAPLVFIAATVAQDHKVTSERPTFRAKVEAVTVAATVRDSSGRHIQGLTAADFTVSEDGKPQRIVSVEEYVTTSILPRELEGNHTYTNQFVAGGERSRIVIILLDLLNANFGDQAQARRHIAKFFANWDTHEPTALVTLSCRGLEVAHDFTRDPALLVAALKQVGVTSAFGASVDVPEGPRMAMSPAASAAEGEANAAFATAMNHAFESSIGGGVCGSASHVTEITTLSLQQLGRSLSGVPGRKSLLWLSAGMPIDGTPESFYGLQRAVQKEIAQPVRNLDTLSPTIERARAYRALADANVAIYPIDAKGLVAFVPLNQNPEHPNRDFGWKNSDEQSRISDLKDTAESTGGKAYYRTNDLSAAMNDAVEDSYSYYMLTYYRNTKDDRPGWRNLSVRVNRSGVQVRSRKGFVVTGSLPPVSTRRSDLSIATHSALNLTDMSIEAHIERTASNGERRIDFSLHVPAEAVTVDNSDSNHVLADWLVVVLKDAKVIASHSQMIDKHASDTELTDLRSNGLSYKSFVTLPESGDYQLRFVIRDGITGRIGTVTVPVKASAATPPNPVVK